ncbi:L,D-transpeptidase family protein [Clostridium sp.]|uniref:L,D-transpeptidase family protein n=1 Tax=Clostridium sp. TaxID=1506 RepID=UPI0028461CF1|nr:L,D-transpeptidase family protein [Clostridium sp.]MDR3598593.1 L,D-transpeptidase family protein [Clostridium sp.]
MEREKRGTNKVIKDIINIFGVLTMVFCMFFVSPIKVSAETANNKDTSINAYALTLVERGEVKEKINGSDIQLKSQDNNNISFDEKLLQECVNKLSCLDTTKTIEPKNARLTYQNNSHVILKEEYGNKVNRDILYKNIVAALKKGDAVLDLDSANCYENPEVLDSSPQIVNARNTANKYISSRITYCIAGLTQVLDGSTIKDWISLDENYQIVLYEEMVRNYVNNMADTYTSSLGTSIPVSGGYDGNNHSWVIDVDQETQALIDNIKSGQIITKGPIYAQTAAASYFSNAGENFVEVDLTNQHVWCYKDGYLAVDGDIVSGNESNGNATPDGVYSLYSKQKNTVLIGPDYASPVSFWMPFNKNIGLHDANWRSEFGGEIYKTNGSHGCVNLPYSVASQIYDNTYVGETVICHY